MALEVEPCKLVDIEVSAELPGLLAEYGEESATDELGPVAPQIPAYRAMEAAGVFRAFSARLDGRLIGFLFLLTPVLPHFGRTVGVCESYFVASAHRKTGAGTLLRRAAETAGLAAGAAGIMFSAPIGGVLERVLPCVGYRDTARIFFKAFR